MKKGLSQEIITRVETLEGMDISDALELRYFKEKLSYRKLVKLWGVNNRTVARIIAHCNRTPRYGSEAVKTQWINNEERKKHAAKVLANTNHNMALKGLHVRQGKTKENSALIRQVAEKLKTSSSFHREDVRLKCQENACKTRIKHPERNPFFTSPETKAERIIRGFLEEHNIKFIFRYIINGYFFNFYLPDYNLILDIQGSNRLPFSFERHQTVLNQNHSIVYCIRYFVEKARFAHLYDYISNLNIIRHQPSFCSKESVIWGARQTMPFGNQCDQVSVKIVRDNISYKTLISAPTNN